jgi:SRSO17 transposase
MTASPMAGWEQDLERWLAPFVAGLRRVEQRRWAPVYLKGLILPGERKSIEPPRPSSTAAAAQTD